MSLYHNQGRVKWTGSGTTYLGYGKSVATILLTRALMYLFNFSVETIKISPRLISTISRYVIEGFAFRLPLNYVLLLIRVSDNKGYRKQLAKAIGLEVPVDKDFSGIFG
jgi:hypothetical protein